MLRDERQVAIDDLIVALENASDAYADAAEILQAEDPPMASRFEALARQRAGLASRLSDHLRAMGDLPSEPDQDREALEVVMRHLKAQFAGPEWDEFLSEAVALEEEIVGRAAVALAAEPGSTAAATLHDVAEDARRTLATLRDLQPRDE